MALRSSNQIDNFARMFGLGVYVTEMPSLLKCFPPKIDSARRYERAQMF